MSLHDRALAAFDGALAAVRADPALDAVHSAIAAQRERYRRKMRVALVGRVSSGKSTLTNGLLGGDYAATGIEELTYNVTCLRHGPSDGMTVWFGSEDRRPERQDRQRLVALATRAHDDPELQKYLAAIAYLEVTDPNPHLEGFDLVDTPGLDAVAGSAQASKTLTFLGRTAEDVRKDTVSFAAQADALVLVFPRALAGTDAELLSDFVHAGLGTANPITAVGALTKIEFHWPRQDPMERGRLDAERLMAATDARRLLFDIRPVAGKVAAAAGVFTDNDFADLDALQTSMSSSALKRHLSFGPAFQTAPLPGLPVDVARRDALYELFGAYGIHLACELIRQGVCSRADLREQLELRSGITDLRRLLVEHFARRSDVVKLQSVVNETRTLPVRFSAGLTPRELDRAAQAVAQVTRLEQEPAFQELTALRHWWQGDLTFTAEQGKELTLIAGEHGFSPAQRLGLPADTDAAGLIAAASTRHAYWSGAVISPEYSGRSHGACQVMLDAYDGILDELRRGHRAAER